MIIKTYHVSLDASTLPSVPLAIDFQMNSASPSVTVAQRPFKGDIDRANSLLLGRTTLHHRSLDSFFKMVQETHVESCASATCCVRKPKTGSYCTGQWCCLSPCGIEELHLLSTAHCNGKTKQGSLRQPPNRLDQSLLELRKNAGACCVFVRRLGSRWDLGRQSFVQVSACALWSERVAYVSHSKKRERLT